MKAQQEGRISAKKRPHEKSHRESSSSAARNKSSRTASDSLVKNSSSAVVSGASSAGVTAAATSAGLDIPEKILRTGSGGSGGSGNGNGMVVRASVPDPNSADHVVAMTNLKERIVSLEKRLQMKDKELLEKDKLVSINYYLCMIFLII